MLRSLGVTAEKRSEDMPEVPTFKESGFPVVITLWYSIYFPKGTPSWIVEKFAKAQEKAFAKYPKEIKEELRKVEITSEYQSFEETHKLYIKEYESLYKLAEDFGVVVK
jgi:tripartite-type tricarboxylate transporter receptor subunit TctC